MTYIEMIRAWLEKTPAESYRLIFDCAKSEQRLRNLFFNRKNLDKEETFLWKCNV